MRTKIIEKYSLSLALLAFLSGCSNALYFYETEKVSLTVEARPDSSQPVQGNLGIKQRVVLLAPKKNKSADAVSAISSFDFKIIPKDHAIFDPIMIQTAFITGTAAANLDDQEAQRAAQAIALGDVRASGADISIMRNIVDRLEQRHTDEDNKQLSLLDGLGKAVMPTNYPVLIFDSDSNGSIKPKTKSLALDTKNPGINSALDYWGELNGSARILKFALRTPNKYKYDGIPVTNEMVKNGLQNEYEKTLHELKRIGQELSGNSIYTNALQYYINQ